MLCRFVFFLGIVVLGLVSSLTCSVVQAQALPPGLGVHPVRVDLDNTHRSDSIVVSNGDSTPQIMRVEGVLWDQTGGKDNIITPIAEDLFVVPPIVNIGGNEEKVIRIGLRRSFSGMREHTFRILITQIPSMLKIKNGAQVAVRLSVPVFVNAAPPTKTGKPDAGLSWQAQVVGPKPHVRLTAVNDGDAHARIEVVRVYSDASKTKVIGEQRLSAYLLAGVTRTFDLTTGAGTVLPTLVVEGSGESGPFNAVVPVAFTAK